MILKWSQNEKFIRPTCYKIFCSDRSLTLELMRNIMFAQEKVIISILDGIIQAICFALIII